MERYIDVDKFIESLQEELDSYPLLYTREQNEWFDRGLKRALRIAKTFTTADVVPKSEVDELKAIIADHKANEERWQELYADTVSKWEKAYEELEIKLENAKAEVALEIFDEIEKALYENKFKGLSCFLNDFAELKKKYTEEKE